MTIDYRILVGSSLTNEEKKNIQEVIDTTFHEIDTIYNKWNPDSELSQVNRLPAHTKMEISPKLKKLLTLTDEIVTISEGRFDPTIEPLQHLWKKRLESGKKPSADEIAAISPFVGWKTIHFKNGVLYKEDGRTSVDLGAIAKGYGVDLLAENLHTQGYSNLFVDWGGEIRVLGEHPDKRPWHIFISRLNDTDPDHAIVHLDLRDQSVATSGDYLQKWSVEGTTYFHIIDPQTFQPLEMKNGSIASASVLASSCALADGLATAAMLFPDIDQAEAWTAKVREHYPEVRLWLLSR